MVIRTGRQPPEWFKLSGYDSARSLDVDGWATMLNGRERWRSWLSGLRRNDILAPEARDDIKPNSVERKAAFWKRYLVDVSLDNFTKPNPEPSSGLGALPRAPRPIEDVTGEAVMAACNPLAQFEWAIGAVGQRVVLVDLAAADKNLKEAFAAWLVGVRKERPPAFKRRGRPSANSGVNAAHLKSWCDYNVLAVFDLDFYAAVFEQDVLAHEDLCDALYPGFPVDGDQKEWGISAREKVKEAIDSVNDLVAQKGS